MNIQTIYFLNQQGNNIISESKHFRNGGTISVGVEGLLDGGKLRYYVSYDNIKWFPYLDSNEIYEQIKEGKEIEIFEYIPFYIKVELVNSSINTNINVIGYYIDKFNDYGIHP